MNTELVLFLVAQYGNNCVVAGNIIQTCKSLYKHKKQIIRCHTIIQGMQHTINGILHRIDGPAVEQYPLCIWYKNGKRINPKHESPAYVSRYVCKYYDDNGKLHRTKGPAVVDLHKGNQYWYHGERIEYKI